MKSPWVEALRGVAFDVPDLAKAEAFYTRTWNLEVVHRTPQAIWLRGSGSDHHLLALHHHDGAPRLRQVTLRARSAEALDAIARAAVDAGGRQE